MRTGIPFWIRKVKEMESLNVYSVDKIRNVCVMGHGGEGKTSLIESMLYMTKATDRMGKIADGTWIFPGHGEPFQMNREVRAFHDI